LTYFDSGPDLAVVGSNGGEDRPPAWWLNLQADPHARITIGRRTDHVSAREATPAEHARLWPVITAVNPGYAGYARRTARPIPVVILTRTKENAPNR
jgi:deazaflavin-dependent oxidoreductase (nitroreductase family)